MVEFKAFKSGIFVLYGIYMKKIDAKKEQSRYNRLGRISHVEPITTKTGERVFQLWVKE